MKEEQSRIEKNRVWQDSVANNRVVQNRVQNRVEWRKIEQNKINLEQSLFLQNHVLINHVSLWVFFFVDVLFHYIVSPSVVLFCVFFATFHGEFFPDFNWKKFNFSCKKEIGILHQILHENQGKSMNAIGRQMIFFPFTLFFSYFYRSKYSQYNSFNRNS